MQTPILLYHSISCDAAPRYKQWAVTPELFDAHLSYLSEQGYTPLTVSELVAAGQQGRLPARPVAITFDDGLADFFTDALPILRAHRFPATLYMVAGFVGGTSGWLHSRRDAQYPMLKWRQLDAIAASGIEVGAHSLTHRQLDTLSRTTARTEIVGSKRAIERRLGKPVRSFAYPFGYYDPTLQHLVQQAGYTSACGVRHALSTTTDDPLALARIIISARTNVNALGRLLAGAGVPVAPYADGIDADGWRPVKALYRV